MNSFKRSAGFTLIEVMITVAIIGILAGIAYPSYKEYVMKGRRSDAKAGLLSLQLAQEKFRANCLQYATGIATTRSCVTGTYNLLGSATSPNSYYDLSIVSADGSAYSLKATRKTSGLQNGDKCGDFLIDQNGSKTIINAATGYTAATCW
jgi:type IV pilus assembly protein PilE